MRPNPHSRLRAPRPPPASWMGAAFALAAVLASAPASLQAQDVVSRTPNLSGGWVGTTSAALFSFNHRFWLAGGAGGEDKLVNSPTMLLGFTLPGRILVAGQYASNSLVVSNTFNEWEALARWGAPPLGPMGLAVTGAYNGAAESVDGEVSVRLAIPLPEAFPTDSIQLLGALRGFSDAVGSGESGWFAGGGVLVHLGSGVSLAGDVGQLESDGVDPVLAWGAGLQLRIPFTPHSLSLQATNTRTNTLQGASVGFETVWGFEFTVPLTYARFFPD